jgi:mitogen-activated protein kinase kinase kinase 2/mitogen-activated protein kinase kinase kinase 3
VLVRRYTRQILEGVEYLHHCKVIHRDIKGSNIMCDTSGNIKLADFGSAKQICSVSCSLEYRAISLNEIDDCRGMIRYVGVWEVAG